MESMIERAHAQTNTCPLHYEENAAERYCYLFQTAEKEADQRLIEEEELKEKKAFTERREEKHSEKLATVKGLSQERVGHSAIGGRMILVVSVFGSSVPLEEAMRQMVSAPVSGSKS